MSRSVQPVTRKIPALTVSHVSGAEMNGAGSAEEKRSTVGRKQNLEQKGHNCHVAALQFFK